MIKNSKDQLEKHLIFRAIIISLLLILPIYIALLIGYFNDFLNGFVFIGLLLIYSLITGLLTMFYRKNKYKCFIFISAFLFSFILFLYECLLLNYESYTYNASGDWKPAVVLKDSGIYILGVGSYDIHGEKDVEKIRGDYAKDGIQLFEFTEITNRDRYSIKTNDLLNFIRTPQTDFEQMGHNVTAFIGEALPFIDDFLKHDNYFGDSAGLALGLSAAFYQEKFDNTVKLGVTGTLEPNGDVLEIGSIKEKMMIAEQNKFPVVILPLENLEEANLIKEELKLTLQFIPVSHIDEAIAAINELNKTTK